MAEVKEIDTNSRTRRRKTGVLLSASPVLHFEFPKEESVNESNYHVSSQDNNLRATEDVVPDKESVCCENNASADETNEDMSNEATITAIASANKGNKKSDSLSAQKQRSQRPRKVRIQTEVETEERPQTAKSDSTRSGHAAKALFDAKSEKSVHYMTAGGKTMKTSTLYQENTKGNDDVLQVRGKLRQLQINYSQTNATLNDRIIMCDILKVTHNQVIPRIKLIHSLERRLHNHRQHSRLQIAINGKKSQELVKTVADMKKAREERIKQKQTIPRKVETLKAITVKDMEKLRNCRYLRMTDRQELGDSM